MGKQGKRCVWGGTVNNEIETAITDLHVIKARHEKKQRNRQLSGQGGGRKARCVWGGDS